PQHSPTAIYTLSLHDALPISGPGGGAVGDQIRERDWQPSTGTLAPLIQLARGETRNATTAPTSSGRPKRPNGSSRRTKSAIPSGDRKSTRLNSSHDQISYAVF